MKSADKKMKRILREGLYTPCDERKLSETVRNSKAAFCENQEEGFLSGPEFLCQQSRYIHKRWWIMQGILLLLLWWILNGTESSFYIQRLMGTAAPLFVVLIMPELWKNQNANSMEIECTAYYSLRQVYTARMILFALTDLLLVSIFLAAVSFSGKATAGEIVIQFLIPFNAACCICFRSLYSKRNGSEFFALFLCIIWTAVWLLIVLNERIYSTISVPAWSVMFFMSVLYLGYCITRMHKKCEEMWEVIPLWS